jgi:hypothetical protein
VTLNRFAKKRDTAEGPIIDALELVGYHVWQLDRPCDLLLWREDMGPGRFRTLEVKTRSGKAKLRIDKRQDQQTAFLTTTGTPVVTTPMEALRAVGAVT